MAITTVTFTINGHTYTNDPTNLSVPEGYRFIHYEWVPALANLVVDILAVAGQVLTNATAAGGSANAASASASAAAASAATAVSAPGTSATSATALTLDLGPQNLTIQTGKAIPVGAKVLLARTSDPAGWWMYGTVTSYDAGTGALTVLVSRFEGGGSVSDWTVSVTGLEGLQGGAGVAPDLSFKPKADAYTAINQDRILADTTDGAFPIALPAAPAAGDWVEIAYGGGWETNPLTINPNGHNINGVSGNQTVGTKGLRMIFAFNGTEWRATI